MENINNVFVSHPADNNVTEFDWGRLTWFVSAGIGNSQDLTVGKCEIKPGCENPSHSHPNCSEVLHVLKGQIDHRIENQDDVPMGEGDTISIPAHVNHSARNTGAGDAVLLICFSAADRETQGE